MSSPSSLVTQSASPSISLTSYPSMTISPNYTQIIYYASPSSLPYATRFSSSNGSGFSSSSFSPSSSFSSSTSFSSSFSSNTFSPSSSFSSSSSSSSAITTRSPSPLASPQFQFSWLSDSQWAYILVPCILFALLVLACIVNQAKKMEMIEHELNGYRTKNNAPYPLQSTVRSVLNPINSHNYV